MWQTLGVFLLTKEWAFSVPVRGKIFRVKSSYIDNLNNQYLKGVIASVFVENQQTINLVESRRLSYRLEPEIFIFDFPQGLGEQRISLKRLDDTNLAWAVTVEVFKGSSMPEINLTISDLSVSNVEGLQEALNDKALLEHQHQISDVENLQDALDTKASNAHSHDVNSIQGLQNALDAFTSAINEKALLEHQHATSEISGLAELIQSLLPTATPVSIINSSTPPANPFTGLIWHEVNSTNDLIESWTYHKDRWISLTKYSLEYWSPTSSIAGNVSYGLPLNNQYNYLFRELSYHCLYSSGTVDSTNYWRVIFSAQPSAINFADSGAIPNNNNQSVVVALNNLLVPSNGERVFLMFNKYGNAPGVRLGAQVRYHLVRK